MACNCHQASEKLSSISAGQGENLKRVSWNPTVGSNLFKVMTVPTVSFLTDWNKRLSCIFVCKFYNFAAYTERKPFWNIWDTADFLDAQALDFVLPKEYSYLITAIRFESEIH